MLIEFSGNYYNVEVVNVTNKTVIQNALESSDIKGRTEKLVKELLQQLQNPVSSDGAVDINGESCYINTTGFYVRGDTNPTVPTVKHNSSQLTAIQEIFSAIQAQTSPNASPRSQPELTLDPLIIDSTSSDNGSTNSLSFLNSGEVSVILDPAAPPRSETTPFSLKEIGQTLAKNLSSISPDQIKKNMAHLNTAQRKVLNLAVALFITPEAATPEGIDSVEKNGEKLSNILDVLKNDVKRGFFQSSNPYPKLSSDVLTFRQRFTDSNVLQERKAVIEKELAGAKEEKTQIEQKQDYLQSLLNWLPGIIRNPACNRALMNKALNQFVESQEINSLKIKIISSLVHLYLLHDQLNDKNFADLKTPFEKIMHRQELTRKIEILRQSLKETSREISTLLNELENSKCSINTEIEQLEAKSYATQTELDAAKTDTQGNSIFVLSVQPSTTPEDFDTAIQAIEVSKTRLEEWKNLASKLLSSPESLNYKDLPNEFKKLTADFEKYDIETLKTLPEKIKNAPRYDYLSSTNSEKALERQIELEFGIHKRYFDSALRKLVEEKAQLEKNAAVVKAKTAVAVLVDTESTRPDYLN